MFSFIKTAAFCATLGALTASTYANLIKNGGFEEVDSVTGRPVGWKTEGGAPLLTVSDLTPGRGKNVQAMTWYPTVISQTISTPLKAGKTYRLSFLFAVPGVTGPDYGCEVKTTLGDAKGKTLFFNKLDMQLMEMDLTPSVGGIVDLRYDSLCQPYDYALLDEVSLVELD